MCKQSWNWFHDGSKISSSNESCKSREEETQGEDGFQYIGSNVESGKSPICRYWSLP